MRLAREHALRRIFSLVTYREVVLVHVVWTCELRPFAHSLTEDHNLLKEEARERFDLGRRIGLTRSPKVVQGIQWALVQKFALGSNVALEALKWREIQIERRP